MKRKRITKNKKNPKKTNRKLSHKKINRKKLIPKKTNRKKLIPKKTIQILSKQKNEKYIQKKQKKKKLTKQQNTQLNRSLVVKYCRCVKKLKYDTTTPKNLEYPICISSVYKKRGFQPPKKLTLKCNRYR